MGRRCGRVVNAGMLARRRVLACVIAWLALASAAWPAQAVLIAGPDGTTNTTAPNPDPGFANVGRMSGLSGVYLGNGWVLTANHVGIGPIVLDGVNYLPVPGSDHRFSNGGGAEPDLIAFKLQSNPPLPDVAISPTPVAVNDELIMIGNGEQRTTATTYMGYDGWFHDAPRAIRWGTNRVFSVGHFDLNTHSFYTSFDDLVGPRRNDPEAQAVDGDSGGAAFRFDGGSSELVGIMFARGTVIPEQLNQPADAAFFGNVSVLVDLDFYASQIDALVDQPDCSNGLDDDLDGYADYPNDLNCLDAFDSSEVPEPGTSIGILAGSAGLWTLGRRRRRDR